MRLLSHRPHISTVIVFALLAAGAAVLWRGHAAPASWSNLEQRLIALSADAGFRVHAVQVVGRERASAAAILAALGVARGTPILSVDPTAAKARLEQVPWVKTASVYRRLPDTLFVQMTEQEPLAYWQRGNALTLIDRDGKPIGAKNLGDYSRLPVLVGDDAPTNADAVIKMLASEPKLAEQVAAAVRVGGRRWNIEFKNGVSVALPEDDATGAWHRLAAIEKNHRILERRVTLVDLRLPDRVYLRLPPELMPKPPKPGRKENPV
ncbi:MAG TPA: cell division protein FtsQ/DivIB [Stellaceae bacterium]|jgi:cell division protein FtsQ